MLDLDSAPASLLAPLAHVVETALAIGDQVSPSEVMVVGARCRDILQATLGHTFGTVATHDLDLALALSSWQSFRSLTAAFPRLGDTGIRYRIADVEVDLLPFGGVEDPRGVVEPPTRREKLSVWAFDEIYADWYSESAAVHDRLYETPAGNDILIAEAADVSLAAVRLLGQDVAATIGPDRLAELMTRWPGDESLLLRELTVRGGLTWPRSHERRRELIAALTRGLTDAQER